MPATEKTWRDMKALHLVFGISSCVLLIATLWLVAKDHNREYKEYQQAFEEKEVWIKTAQLDEFETVQFAATEQRLVEAVREAQLTVPNPLLVDRFAVQLLYAQLAKAGPVESALEDQFTQLIKLDLDELDSHADLVKSLLTELQKQVPDHVASTRILDEGRRLQEMGQALVPLEAAANSETATADKKAEQGEDAAEEKEQADEEYKDAAEKFVTAREDLFGLMRGQIARVKFVEDEAAKMKKARSAQLDEAKSKLDLAVRDGKSPEVIRELGVTADTIKGDTSLANGASQSEDEPKAGAASVTDWTRAVEAATFQRSTLESILKSLTEAELTAHKNLVDHSARRKTLNESLPRPARNLLGLPILDAFGGPWKPKQVWLPLLKQPQGSFGQVARFDRCVSCHLGIDKSAPGTADVAGYPHLHELTLFLRTPEEAPELRKNEDGEEIPHDVESLYGFRLAETGWADPTDVSVKIVWPGQAAAEAGLSMGDAITHVKVGSRVEQIKSRTDAMRYLVQEVVWGQPIELTVKRGLPQPFSTHPRLDLFVGSLSPHKIGEMGCTICHEGQGSATEFIWTSHTPDNPEQAHEWARKYGYFNNHHWIFPMRPERFIESSCLKCHHEVEQLAPSERFPEPPAPKLTEGYELVKSFGCYGCHEINGYNGPDQRIGPDLRNEPPYFAAAAQLAYQVGPRKELLAQVATAGSEAESASTAEQGLGVLNEIHELAKQVAHHPDDEAARQRIYFLLQLDAERADAAKRLLADPGLSSDMRLVATRLKTKPAEVTAEDRQTLVDYLREDQAEAEPRLRPDASELAELLSSPPLLTKSSHKLGELLKTVESPGTLRRPGPSLRHVASKLGGDTLFRWIMNPKSIRPSTKMPRFFSQHHTYNYLSGESADKANRFEPIEAYTAAVYLLDKSQPFDYLPMQPGVTEEPDFDRGRDMFRTKGCLACHQHSENPGDAEAEMLGHSDQGPNLSELGKKLRAEKGKKWLHSWILKPNHYNLRTRMPNVMLEPEPLLDAEGQPQEKDGKVAKYDPAADIVEYLLGEDWSPQADKLAPLNAEQKTALDELTYEYLGSAFPETRAQAYLKSGIPAKVARKLVGHEVELGIEPFDEAKQTPAEREAELLQKKMVYVGRRTIGKLGCVGCHDVPGLEAEKPIGTTLADWGRKESSKLAFEHVAEYLAVQQSHFGKSDDEGHGEHPEAGGKDEAAEEHHEHVHLDPAAWDRDGRNEGYFIEALHHHQREAFLWQKLREPRSPDYEKTGPKGYNERLRMPLFNWHKDDKGEFTAQGRREIEAVMTFVLGLVAEPPAEQYIHHPAPRQKAIVDGEKVLARYNCAGCHQLTLDRWDISFDPEVHEFDPPPAGEGYPFLRPFFTPDEIQESLRADVAGKRKATLRGMVRLEGTGFPEKLIYDAEYEEFSPMEEGEEYDPAAPRGFSIELWEPTVIDGKVFDIRSPLPTISSDMITAHVPARGGQFARDLVPLVLELQGKEVGSEAMAWVPPPLIGQGNKTQSEWLHAFLLDPHPIRPAVVLRMPKFNMSSDEARRLVHYFAARDNSDYPHQFNHRTRQGHLASSEAEYEEKLAEEDQSVSRLEDAFQIVVNKEGCVKCHLVQDFDPGGSPQAKGPNLTDVSRRLQAEYLKRWLAKPDSILPYTKMPVNFPYGAEGFVMVDAATGAKKQLYHGNSTEQINALVDLLLNFDSLLASEVSIKDKVTGSQPASGEAAAPTEPTN